MKRNIYTTGECILDVTFRENEVFFLSPGGSKLNTAVSLGRAGLPVHMVSECSDDPVGRFILSFLRSNNVSTEFIASCGGQVRIAFAFLDADNDAHYTFYKGMQNESPAWKEPAFAQDDLLLFGSFYSLKAEHRPNIMKLITAARGSGCILVYDPNYRTPHLRELASVTPSILENIQLADIVRGSDEDFGNIFQTCDPDRIYSQVVSAGGKTLILTQGSREVVLFTEKIRKAYPVPAIRTVSTIGAGDSFNAGLIFEMVRSNISRSDLMSLEEEEWNRLIGTAIAFASHVCTEKSNFISIDFATHLLQLNQHFNNLTI